MYILRPKPAADERWKLRADASGVSLQCQMSVVKKKKKNITYQESTRREAKGWKDERARGFFRKFRKRTDTKKVSLFFQKVKPTQ